MMIITSQSTEIHSTETEEETVTAEGTDFNLKTPAIFQRHKKLLVQDILSPIILTSVITSIQCFLISRKKGQFDKHTLIKYLKF